MVHTQVPNTQFCNLCSKKIQNRQKSAKCLICKSTSHLKCNKIEYEIPKGHDEVSEIFMCVQCNQNNLPFYDSKDRKHEYYNREFLASDDIKMFFKEINDSNNKQEHTIDNNVDEHFDISPIINCKYVDINSLKLHKVDSKSFSLLQLNIGSLEKKKTS